MHLRRLSAVALFSSALFAPLARHCMAGSWQYTYTVIAGTATTSNTQAIINSNKLNPGTVFTLPSFPTSMSLSTNYYQPFITKSNTASADGVTIHCVLTWFPDAGKNLMTDPPPTSIDAALTLQCTQFCGMSTNTAGATFHGVSSVAGDSINVPDLVLDLTASNTKTVSTTVKKIHRSLGVTIANGMAKATLDVPVSLKNVFNMTVPGMIATENSVSVTASLSLAVTVKDAVLTTPDPTVFPETFPTLSGDGRNRYVFSKNVPGVLTDPSQAGSPSPTWVATFIGVADATPYLPATTFTSFDINGSTRTDGQKMAAGSTITQQFTYTNLPPNNDDFNDGSTRYKVVKLQVASADINTTQTAHVQTFFPFGSANHPVMNLPKTYPAGLAVIPNWYYYWLQIPEVRFGDPYWGGFNGVQTGVTTFDANQAKWICLIYNQAGYTTGAGTWNNANGIDLFANILRHEETHRSDATNLLWGNRNSFKGMVGGETGDDDGDFLPTDVLSPAGNNTRVKEHDLGAMYHPELRNGGYDPSMAVTPGLLDHFHYGPSYNDGEDFCLHRQPAWTNGTADSKDWAYPGHQWQ